MKPLNIEAEVEGLLAAKAALQATMDPVAVLEIASTIRETLGKKYGEAQLGDVVQALMVVAISSAYDDDKYAYIACAAALSNMITVHEAGTNGNFHDRMPQA